MGYQVGWWRTPSHDRKVREAWALKWEREVRLVRIRNHILWVVAAGATLGVGSFVFWGLYRACAS